VYVKTRQELTDLLAYIQLMTSLTPKHLGGITNPEIKQGLMDSYEFLRTAEKAELIKRAPILREKLKPLIRHYQKKFPPLKPIGIIATEFNEFFKNPRSVLSFGIEYGWLQSAIDCSAMHWPSDFPYHTRIGLAHNAGNGRIEEDFLLRDAFFTLLQTEETFDLLIEFGKVMKKAEDEGRLSEESHWYEEVTGIKTNVATYSRLSIVSFYSFFECFVNSIGFDFLRRNETKLSESEASTLKGYAKTRYLKLEQKIEMFPGIIRADKKRPIVTSDDKQIRDPFKTFFERYKDLRDASVHYSPMKEPIWLKPDDWVKRAKEFSELTLNSALLFWKACYPESEGPEYLGKLDITLHRKLAKQRVRQDRKFKNEYIKAT
jgi:hypothetical protein